MTIAGTKAPRIPTSVIIPEDVRAEIQRAADIVGMPLSTAIRHAAAQWAKGVLRQAKDEAA